MEPALRFLIGGALVSLFAAIGSAFTPKTFAGLFGSAPPVALAGLGLSFRNANRLQITQLGRSMLLGTAALLVYAAICVWLARRQRVWLLPGALVAWTAWFASAGILLAALGLS